MNPPLVVILGPTAVGKTKLAAELCFKFNGEVISADSRQVYRGLDIGTGKDYGDYLVNGNEIPYHLIDIVEPKEEFNLYRFLKTYNIAVEEIHKRGKLPFLTGGTGLFLDAVINRYQLKETDFFDEEVKQLKKLSIEQLLDILKNTSPALHNTTDTLVKDRIINAILVNKSKENYLEVFNTDKLILGVFADRDVIKKRITERLKKRLKEGMIEEVQKILDSGVSHERLELLGLEYKFISLYLQGKLNYNDMYQKLNSAIHQFAKRQMTWFRKIERTGAEIIKLNGADYLTASKKISEFLECRKES